MSVGRLGIKLKTAQARHFRAEVAAIDDRGVRAWMYLQHQRGDKENPLAFWPQAFVRATRTSRTTSAASRRKPLMSASGKRRPSGLRTGTARAEVRSVDSGAGGPGRQEAPDAEQQPQGCSKSR